MYIVYLNENSCKIDGLEQLILRQVGAGNLWQVILRQILLFYVKNNRKDNLEIELFY